MSRPKSPANHRVTMSQTGSDRNLLFGILALQMDFVSRDVLVEAMNSWVLEKSKSLGKVLAERGVLQDDEHRLLEALVAKHLQKHGGDPARSVAALSSVWATQWSLEIANRCATMLIPSQVYGQDRLVPASPGISLASNQNRPP